MSGAAATGPRPPSPSRRPNDPARIGDPSFTIGSVTRIMIVPLVVALALTACGDDSDTPSADADEVATISYRERVTTLDDAVAVWQSADTIETAHAAAEAAANLVVGPNGPGYGDRDGNGTVDGDSTTGLLPGLDGEPVGLASALSDNACVAADVLGGDWADPAARWAELETTVSAWTPEDNTMPDLASEAMRIVGWAELTLATDSVDEATEYGGHATLHVQTALDALDC